MKYSLVFLFFSNFLFSQIKTIEFVKIINDKKEEAFYYYENNWKPIREAALKKKHIKSYEFLVNEKGDSEFDIILITAYRDSLQFKLSEERFQKIIKELRPNGPLFLNDLKPNTFRKSTYSSNYKVIVNSKTK